MTAAVHVATMTSSIPHIKEPIDPEPFTPTSNTTFTSSDPTPDFDGNVEVSTKLPSKSEVKKVENLPILDVNHKSHPFKTLFSGDRATRRVLVIFVRHFFCGNCQEYLRTLSSSITPDLLRSSPTPTQLVVIGCGKPDLIPFYAETSNCTFPIYADPTRTLYNELGMTRTMDLGPKKPEYVQNSLFSSIVQAIYQGVKSGRGATKGGDFWQVGGEFLFEDGRVTWCHRMRNTRDHTEIPQLRKLLGLDVEGTPVRRRWTRSLSRTLSSKRQSWSGSRRSGEKDSKEGSVMEQVKEEKEARQKDDLPVEK